LNFESDVGGSNLGEVNSYDLGVKGLPPVGENHDIQQLLHFVLEELNRLLWSPRNPHHECESSCGYREWMEGIENGKRMQCCYELGILVERHAELLFGDEELEYLSENEAVMVLCLLNDFGEEWEEQ
jgi:hypothetical protein